MAASKKQKVGGTARLPARLTGGERFFLPDCRRLWRVWSRQHQTNRRLASLSSIHGCATASAISG